MAYLPVKARSELVIPVNFSDGGVFESTCRFQAASPASNFPARRPTRGSGLGAVVDMSPVGVGALAPETTAERAHAPAESSPMTNDSFNTAAAGRTSEPRARYTDAMSGSSSG